MKKRNRRLLAVLCAVVTAAGIAAPAMTPVYAAQNEVTNEEVNAEVMSAGNTKDDVDDSGNADEQEDVYSLKYITVDGRTAWYYANEKGEVCKAKLVKLESKFDKKAGRNIMAEVAGSEYEVPVDLVLIAAGFLGSQSYVTKAFGLDLTERTNVKTVEGHFKTNVDKVFTAGDMHRGQSLVVWAIREGRDCAREVDKALMGYSNL